MKFQLLQYLKKQKTQKRIVDITKHDTLNSTIEHAELTKKHTKKFEIYTKKWTNHHLTGKVLPNNFIEWIKIID